MTTSLGIGQLDTIRDLLGPSEIRESHLKLHGLAMEFINEGFTGDNFRLVHRLFVQIARIMR